MGKGPQIAMRGIIRHSKRYFSAHAGTPIHVFGHTIPDTDAICAAMVRAWELEQHGRAAQAFRLGSLNKETECVNL